MTALAGLKMMRGELQWCDCNGMEENLKQILYVIKENP